ncbi:hypothetical protein BJX66DRAFT_339835 [Aspergillus keveii]|uniref:Zn(2)-C6 fungal-type domain-containing protein n=1 Tax=Aspergillus keveii TaxID=714993 RepID=A0ABR4G076_9EURO
MENANPISAIPLDAEPRLETATVDPLSKNEPPRQLANIKVARKRTKTGCLTCRQRRIKCGEEKPICKNCTKSKRECKGYAQRLIFKNPLGIPGVLNPIPTQSQPLPSQYEGEIDLQHVTSAGTHGPILAPKLHAIPDSAQQPAPQYSAVYTHDISHDDAVFAKEFTVPAQTLLPEPRTRRVADHSAPHHQQRQEPVSYDQFSIRELGQRQQGTEDWAHQEVETADLPQPSQIPQKLGPGPVHYESTLPAQQYVEPHRVPAPMQLGSSMTPLSPFEYMDDDDDDPYDVETDEEAEEQVKMQNLNQLNMVMASAHRDEKQLRLFTTYLDEPNMLATYQPTYSSSPLNNPKTARIFLHFIHATGPALSVFERHPIDGSTRFGAPVPIAQQGLWTYTLPLKAFDHLGLQQAMLALSSLHIAYLQGTSSAVSLKHYQYALRRVGKAVGLPARRKQLGTLAASLLLAYYEVMTADHIKWNNHLGGSAQLLREIDFAGLTRDLRAQRRSRWLAQSHVYGSFMDNYLFSNPTSSDDPFAELENEIDENMVGIFLGRAVNYDQFGQVEEEHTRSRKKHLSPKDIETLRIQSDLYWWFCKQDWLQSIISGQPLFLPFSHWGQCPPRARLGRLDAIYGSADHLSLLMGRLADFGVRDRKRKIKLEKAAGPGGWQPDARFGMFMARYGPPRPGNQGKGPFGPPPPGAARPHHPPGSGPPPNVHAGNGAPQGPGRSNMNPRGPPGGSSGAPPGNPPMYGMMPSVGRRGLPPAFAATLNDQNDFFEHKDDEEEVSYEEAVKEWEDIFAAFDAFEQSIGPDFMPLPADSTIPIYSPFGPALQYRTHNMGSLWGFYYIGRILLLRLHPSMPPAMMVAAGYAGAATAHHAQAIGRIAAGIYGPQSRHHGVEGFSPTLGSCLIEASVALFFAGVQYVDPDQREWTVTVLDDISRLTGIKSSDAISRGCKTAWTAASKRPGGPPYNPDARPDAHDPPAWKYYEKSEANTERRWVPVPKASPGPLTWAMGILSVEDNIFEETG